MLCVCLLDMILMAYLKRAKDRVTQFKKVSSCTMYELQLPIIIGRGWLECHRFLFLQNYTEPSSEKLLPDHLPYPYQRPYTLIIDLNDVLIHSEYDV